MRWRLKLVTISAWLCLSCLNPIAVDSAAQTWSSPVNISNNSGRSQVPSITTDSSGNIHLVWYDNTPGNNEIYYSRSSNSGISWSNPVNISNNSGSPEIPSITTDSSENLHVVWQDYHTPDNFEIYYSRSSNSGITWSDPVNISHNSGASWSLWPEISTDSLGNIHVVWLDKGGPSSDKIYYSRSSDSGITWSNPVSISNNLGRVFHPHYIHSISTDSLGNIHVVWCDGDIFYRRSSDSGISWLDPVKISNNIGFSVAPSITVDSSGNIHLVCELVSSNPPFRPGIVYSRSGNSGLSWLTPVNIPNASGNYPSITADSSGNLHLVWHTGEIYYSRSSDSGASWSTPSTNISNNAGSSLGPSISTDSSGNIHLVWQDDTPGNNQIYYSRTPPPPSATNSRIRATSPVVADGVAASNIRITVKDANENPLSGRNVTISATGSDNTITLQSSTTNTNGQTTATLKSTKAETKTITAIVDFVSLSTTVIFKLPTIARPAPKPNIPVKRDPTAPAWTWSSPVNISNSSTDSIRPSITTDSSGNIHLVWQDNTPGNYEIFYSRSSNSGISWSNPFNISNNSGFSIAPSITVDSSGKLHLVWQDNTPGNYEIYYSRSSDSGISWWSPPVNISKNSRFSSRPSITVDSSGNLHAVWRDYPAAFFFQRVIRSEILYSRSSDSGISWLSPVNISNTSEDSDWPSITTDSSGKLHVVWQDNAPGNNEIYYSRSSNSGISWSTPVNISHTFEESDWPSITVDSSGKLHLVWGDFTSGIDEIFYSRSSNSGISWLDPVNISHNSGFSVAPSITVDSSGNLHLVWDDDTPGNFEIFYSRSSDSGISWSTPVNISHTSEESDWPSITVDSSGNIHLVWQDNTPGNFEIFYSRALPSPSATNSQITATSPVVADGRAVLNINISVKDASGNPLSGRNVTISATPDRPTENTITQPSVPTNASGQTTATFKSTKAGTKTIKATVDSISFQTTVTFIAGAVSASTSTLLANPPTLPADGAAEATVTITLLDANNNPVSGKNITISATGEGHIITPPTSATDSNGQTTARIKSTRAEAKTISAIDTTDNISLINTVTVTFVTLGPIITLVDTTLSANAGQPKTFKVRVTNSTATTTIPAGNVRLVYKSGEGAFTSLPMFDDGLHNDNVANDGIWARELAASLITLKGLSVYFTATDNVGNTTDIITLADGITTISPSTPANVEVTGDITSPPIPVWRSSADWTMLSFPVKLPNEDPEVVFRELGTVDVNWQAYQYNGGADYDRAIRISRPGDPRGDVEKFISIGSGKACWIWHDQTVPATVTVRGAKSLNPAKVFAIKVSSGWNMIANPFMFNIPWNNMVKFETTNNLATADAILTAAADNQVANPPIIYLRSTTGYTRISAETTPSAGTVSGDLEPWKGYWFLAKKDGWLFIDPNQATTGPPPIAPTYEPYEAVAYNYKGWLVELNANDIKINAGMAENALDLQDSLDFPTPPPVISESIRFAFSHPEWNDRFATHFDQDIRTLSRDGATWKVEVMSDGKPLTISWRQLYEVPKEYMLMLVDPTTGLSVDLRKETSYTITLTGAGEGSRKLYFVASIGGRGIPEFLARLIVKKTELLQNFPNPFNPETWIPYQLSELSEVEIRIYEASGRLVRRLRLGYKEAGMYISKDRAAYWDGRNDLGERAASGVYFYQLQARGFSSTMSVRKMLVLK